MSKYLYNNDVTGFRRKLVQRRDEDTTTTSLLRTKLHIWLSYSPTPPLGQDMTLGQFLSGV